MVHVHNAANPYNSIIIRTVNSNVVVLAVYVFGQLTSSLYELLVAFYTDDHNRLFIMWFDYL